MKPNIDGESLSGSGSGSGFLGAIVLKALDFLNSRFYIHHLASLPRSLSRSFTLHFFIVIKIKDDA